MQLYLPIVRSPVIQNIDACQKGNKVRAKVKVYPNKLSFRKISLWSYLNLFKGIKARAWSDVGFFCYGKYEKANFAKLFFEELTKKVKDSDALSVLFAVNLGQKDLVGRNLFTLFRNLGLSHFLVVSGFHIGLFYFSIFYILDYLISRSTYVLSYLPSEYLSAPICCLLTWIYASLTGFALPTLRAVIFLSIVVIYRFLNIKVSSMHKLLLTASLIIFIWPKSIFEISFILSFFAVVGVLVGLELSSCFTNVSFFSASFFKGHNKLMTPFFISLGAWLYTLPVSLIFFKKLYAFSVLVNFLLTPILTVLVCYLGSLSLLLAYFEFFSLIRLMDLALNNLLQYLWYISDILEDFMIELEFNAALQIAFVILLFNCIFFLCCIVKTRGKKEQFSELASSFSY